MAAAVNPEDLHDLAAAVQKTMGEACRNKGRVGSAQLVEGPVDLGHGVPLQDRDLLLAVMVVQGNCGAMLEFGNPGGDVLGADDWRGCLLYTSPSPRDCS